MMISKNYFHSGGYQACSQRLRQPDLQVKTISSSAENAGEGPLSQNELRLEVKSDHIALFVFFEVGKRSCCSGQF
jgi:hypothetical protein